MNLLELFAPIRTFVFDADGVYARGTFLLNRDGDLAHSISSKDELAIRQAIQKGYNIWVFAGDELTAIRHRLTRLGVHDIFTGAENKKDFLLKFVAESQTNRSSILYIGYDIPDLSAMELCGLSCSPADAADEVKQAAKYVSAYAGGGGCLRDVIEKVLKLNNDWDS